MKKSNWHVLEILLVILALPLVVCVIYLLVTWLIKQTEKSLNTLVIRLKTVRERICISANILKAEQRRKNSLDTKAQWLMRGVKFIAVFFIAVVYMVFQRSGFSPIESLSHMFFVVTVGGAAIMFVIKSRIFDLNVIMQKTEFSVTAWIYQKNRFDPKRITQLRREINDLHRQEKEIENDMIAIENPKLR